MMTNLSFNKTGDSSNARAIHATQTTGKRDELRRKQPTDTRYQLKVDRRVSDAAEIRGVCRTLARIQKQHFLETIEILFKQEQISKNLEPGVKCYLT